MPLLDDLSKQLEGYFHTVSGVNYVKIYDTPRVWGLPFGREIMGQAAARQAEFQQAITNFSHPLLHRCDIASLNAPDKDWRLPLLDALDKTLSVKAGRSRPPQIRFLFGQTPAAALSGIQYCFLGSKDYRALKRQIRALVRARAAAWEVMPEIWIGRFFRIVKGLANSLEDKLIACFPPLGGLLKSRHTKMTWNHSKIIAWDGYESFAGGHNLNMDLFRSYPPVHDVSVKVLGDAPLSAQLFLNEMWNAGADLLTREYYDAARDKWIKPDRQAQPPHDPLREPEARDYIRARQEELQAQPPREPGYAKASRILSVGKYWTGPDWNTDYQKGSEVMKEFLIKNAKKLIRMSQQDIVSVWKKQWQKHPVCQWLAEALLANPELRLQIVVSPLNAAAGAKGDQYSFGSGAERTFEILKYYLTHDAETDRLLPDPGGRRAAALGRIEVAPFFYTDKVPQDRTREGETYQWPDADKEADTATLRQKPLAERPPRRGVINHPFMAALHGSGLFRRKVPPAPGNHAKVTIIDDELYIAGSDNMYPGYHSEFNYVVEGEDAVSDFIKSYWQPLWQYSSPHACRPAPSAAKPRPAAK